MKKTEVTTSFGKTLPGWQTDTPGLVLAKYKHENWQGNQERWVLWHAPTGKKIRTYMKRADGQRFAALLDMGLDWTFEGEVVPLEHRLAYREALTQEGETE